MHGLCSLLNQIRMIFILVKTPPFRRRIIRFLSPEQSGTCQTNRKFSFQVGMPDNINFHSNVEEAVSLS